MKEETIILNNQEYIYIINRKNIKHIYFRVKEDLKIYVNANKLVSKRYIETLLKNNEKEIIKMYDTALNKLNNNELKYLGTKLNLIIMNVKPYIMDGTIYVATKEEAEKYIYSKSKTIFKERLDNIAPLFNDLPSFDLKIRKMKSKWGVCNIKSMSITLNSELIKKDVHLIDYVIIHELCHFKHMNHSKEYWNYLSQFYPDYKKARKELKIND